MRALPCAPKGRTANTQAEAEAEGAATGWREEDGVIV